MDEPFSALDPLIRTKLQDELLSLQKNLKKTILFVSHDLDEAMKLGNRIAIMEGGRIVQSGTPEDIILRPANDYVAEFVAHMNPLNVVKARSIMRPLAQCARDGDCYFIDEERKASIYVDASGKALSAKINDVDAPLLRVEADGVIPNNAKHGIAIASPEITLKTAIALRQTSGHGLGLVDADGRLIGLCDDSDLFGGLLRERR